MNWQDIWAWVQANMGLIALVLLVVIGIGIQIARGKGRALAQLALDFLLLEAKKGLDEVSKEDIANTVTYLYGIAPGRIWIIPWKILVGKEQAVAWAWEGFNKLHGFLDTAGAITLKRSLNAQRKMRGVVIAP